MPYTLTKGSPDVLLADELDNADNKWTLNFGPQHPATHTTLRLVLELDGERIIKATPHIGYLHSGFEKLMEHLNYNQNVTIVDRMDYSAPIYNEIAFHHATEKLIGIELTPRCKVLRTLANELARIQSHLLCVGAAGLDLGAFTAFLYGFNQRETIYDIVEYMSGQRFHTSWTRVGGLNMDLPDEAVFKRMVKKFVNDDLPPAMDDVERLLNKNRIFIDRTKGIGVISRAEAISWSLTGPMARASGVPRDIRKDEPYLCYADNWDGQGSGAVKFEVPVMKTGDVYARYLVRLEEMRQSINIIKQLIDNIPSGPVNVSPEGKEVMPPKDQVYSSIEGLIHHFEMVMTNRGFATPKGEIYGCIESANGELGYYIVSAGENVPWRARTRPNSYINYQVFPKLIEGHMISDVVAVLGSINVIAAELDR
ncbi:MAG TPA: NADH-quinone oxidoreductase subunit D [Tepidisphaeraceae bacterium]|jgi:NADH-quinone oxidoreductase subunit D